MRRANDHAHAAASVFVVPEKLCLPAYFSVQMHYLRLLMCF